MNLQHLKYMVEVEKVGSITKAAANLFMGQPNLSKAIKEVESEVGIPIFKRSAKGVFPTEKGSEFLEYARTILAQMDKIEALYKPDSQNTVNFCISVPRATYITHAFTSFVNGIDKSRRITMDFRETNSVDAISNVCDSTSSIGVIRYDIDYEEYFMSHLTDKSLKWEPVLTFEYLLLMSKDDPLASEEVLSADQLSGYTEIVHGDSSVPYLSSSYTRRSDQNQTLRRINIYERGSQFDLLTEVKNTFMWVSPMPKITLSRFGLVQKRCFGTTKIYKDVLIHKNNYHFTEQDTRFVEQLYKSRDEVLKK
ncbi:MAG: LysR family transcriptional regulator [Oscillospiraceae bacterium]